MVRFKFNGLIFRAATILFVSVLILSGCSRSPLGIDTENQQPQLLKRSAAFTSAAQLSSSSFYIEKVISAKDGGKLSLFDVTLDIPPDAVNKDELFSINIPDISVFYNEFGTDGLVFNKPVKVTMSYRDADLGGVKETTIRIAWFNKSTGKFEDVVCNIDYDKKVVTGQLNHFSAYALISD